MPAPRSGVLTAILFTASIFIAAGLLFVVQPMTARGLLPLLGGSPAVWTTAMLFFQSALLAGYAWAHLIARGRAGPALFALHALVLAGAVAMAITLGWRHGRPPAEALPLAWLLGELLVAVGPGFFALASAGPLLQRWYAATNAPRAGDPYFLFAASNAGSMLGLLLYPLAVEPMLALDTQRRFWIIAFGAAALLILACGVLAMRSRPGALTAPADADQDAALAPAITWRRRGWWLLLAFVPSTLMLGATGYLSTDVAAFPLLWVVPLAIYLLSFVIAFGPRRGIDLAAVSRFTLILLIASTATIALGAARPLWIIVLLHVLTLGAGAVLCHGRLAADRPAPARLTEFYLIVSIGGALGGIFNAVVAPLLFDVVAEYPIAIILAATLCIAPAAGVRLRRVALVLPVGLAIYLLAVHLALPAAGMTEGYIYDALIVAVPLIGAFLAAPRPPALAACLALLLISGAAERTAGIRLERIERTFFGVHRVERTDENGPPRRALMHGRTLHGVTLLDQPGLPTGYYHPRGPAGEVFRSLNAGNEALDVGLVGLGVGSLAAYGRPTDAYAFYEIDPVVVDIAQDAELFPYLTESPARIAVAIGDGRLLLEDAADARYDLLVLDAFSSDAIPVHLLTREAFELYMSRLKPGGVLLVHLSNQHLDLPPVVAAIAHDLGLASRVRYADDPPPLLEEQELMAPSVWAAVARRPQDIDAATRRRSTWLPLEPRRGRRVWTDQYSNVLGAVAWD